MIIGQSKLLFPVGLAMAIGAAFPSMNYVGYAGLILGLILSIMSPLSGVVILISVFYWPVVQFGSYYSNVPVAIILTLSIVGGILLDYLRLGTKIQLKRIDYFLILAFVAYMIISLIFTDNFSSGVKYLEWAFRGISIFLILTVVVRNELHLLGLVKSLAIIGFITFLIALAHNITGLSRFWTIIKPEHDVVDIFNRIIVYGTEPNYLAISYLPTAACAIISFIYSSSKLTKIFWAIVTSGIMLGIVGTYSRAGMIGLIVLVILFVLFEQEATKLVVPTLVLLVIALLTLQPDLINRFQSIYTSIVYEGATGRFYYWNIATDIWLNNAVSLMFGIGIGGFVSLIGEAVHNTPLTILVDLGLLGFLIYYAPAVYLILKRRKGVVPNLKMLLSIRKGLVFGYCATFFGYLTISDMGAIPLYVMLGLISITNKYLVSSISMRKYLQGTGKCQASAIEHTTNYSPHNGT